MKKFVILLLSVLMFGAVSAQTDVENFGTYEEYVNVMAVRGLSGYKVLKVKKNNKYVLHNLELDFKIRKKIAKQLKSGDLLFYNKKDETYLVCDNKAHLDSMIRDREEEVRKQY